MKPYQPSIGATSWADRRNYSTYKSPYGPKYTVPTNVSGWTLRKATGLGLTLSAFGVSAGIFALFFFSDVPRVRKDIIQKIPIIGDHFVKEIPPSDNIIRAKEAGLTGGLRLVSSGNTARGNSDETVNSIEN